MTSRNHRNIDEDSPINVGDWVEILNFPFLPIDKNEPFADGYHVGEKAIVVRDYGQEVFEIKSPVDTREHNPLVCRSWVKKTTPPTDPPIHPDCEENPLATAEAGVVSIILAALAIVALVLALVG